MFTTGLIEFRTEQEELQRRAAHYRLVKSLEGSNQIIARIKFALGQLMVHLGRQLVANAQPAR